MLPTDLLRECCRFLTLGELNSLLSLSSQWPNIVRTMPSIKAGIYNQFQHLVDAAAASSPLIRHITAVTTNPWIGREQLNVLASIMPHITECSVSYYNQSSLEVFKDVVPASLSTPLVFPPLLCSIRCHFNLDEPHGPALIEDFFINAADQCANLQSLDLTIWGNSATFSKVSFAHLARMGRLRCLAITLDNNYQFTNAQMDQIRTITSVEEMYLGSMDPPFVEYLLRPPHALQWKKFSPNSDRDSDALVDLCTTLPLVKFSISDMFQLSNLSYLHRLPHLTDLELNVYHRESPFPREDSDWLQYQQEMVEGIQSCPLLTRLSLFVGLLSDDHLSVLLPRLKHLETLILWQYNNVALQSLSCLNVATTLTDLAIGSMDMFDPPMPLSELAHLLPLKRLTCLEVRNFFPQLGDWTRQFSVPSKHFLGLDTCQFFPHDSPY